MLGSPLQHHFPNTPRRVALNDRQRPDTDDQLRIVVDRVKPRLERPGMEDADHYSIEFGNDRHIPIAFLFTIRLHPQKRPASMNPTVHTEIVARRLLKHPARGNCFENLFPRRRPERSSLKLSAARPRRHLTFGKLG